MGNCCYDPPYGYNAAGAFGPYTATTTTYETYPQVGVVPGAVVPGAVVPGTVVQTGYPGGFY